MKNGLRLMSVCSCNHEGNAGKMEVNGMIEIFKRSEEKCQVLYTGYIGDGDSKTFQAIAEEKPYNDCAVEKKSLWATYRREWVQGSAI